MKSEIYKIKVDTADELLARILDVAVRINKRENQLRRTMRDFRTRVAKWTEVYGVIFKYLLWTVTILSSKHQIKITINSNYFNTMYHVSFLFCTKTKNAHNYFTNYHTATCFDTIVSSSYSL